MYTACATTKRMSYLKKHKSENIMSEKEQDQKFIDYINC